MVQSALMGQDFIIVNRTHRTYIDPFHMEASSGYPSILESPMTRTALTLLCCQIPGGTGYWRDGLSGSWRGCDIRVLGDYQEEAYRLVIRTYENVTPHVTALICEINPVRALELAHGAASSFLTMNWLGDAAALGNCPNLESSLNHCFNGRWREAWALSKKDPPVWPPPFARPIQNEAPPVLNLSSLLGSPGAFYLMNEDEGTYFSPFRLNEGERWDSETPHLLAMAAATYWSCRLDPAYKGRVNHYYKQEPWGNWHGHQLTVYSEDGFLATGPSTDQTTPMLASIMEWDDHLCETLAKECKDCSAAFKLAGEVAIHMKSEPLRDQLTEHLGDQWTAAWYNALMEG